MLGPLVLVCLLSPVLSVDTSKTGSQLEVLNPASLRSIFKASDGTVNGLVDNQPALFGNPMGGGEKATSGILVYSALTDENACEPFNSTETENWPKGSNLIVLVDRGSCYFVDKVQHVQDAGGHAAIVVDNTVEAGIPYMADYQNRGMKINIPSILIHRNDGQKLKEALKSGAVTVSMRWNLPHPDNRVEWDLWTSSADTQSEAQFKQIFAPANKAFGKDTLFTPHYYFNKYPGCLAKEGEQSECEGCTNSGRYCNFEGGSKVNGTDIVAEDLRQICIYKTLNETSYEATFKWWDYVNQFGKMCAASENFTQTCSENCMKGCGIDAAKVSQCVNDSGGSGLIGGENTLLEAEYSKRRDLGIYASSTILINNQPFRGSVTCPSPLDKNTCGPFSMICLGFKDSSLIPACSTEPGCEIGKQKNECGDCDGLIVKDACGLCLAPNASAFNSSCLDCANVPNGKATRDDCGLCYDENDPRRISNGTENCNSAKKASTAAAHFPTWAVVVMVLSCILVVAGGVYYYMRRREEAMRNDIDDLFKQYNILPDNQQNSLM